MREFESGATRNSDSNKLDYEGFLNPLVLQRYAQYMHKHTILEDGTRRESDNWQKGIPSEQCLKSLYRHLIELHLAHRGYEAKESIEDSLCAIIFNAMAYLLNQQQNK